MRLSYYQVHVYSHPYSLLSCNEHLRVIDTGGSLSALSWVLTWVYLTKMLLHKQRRTQDFPEGRQPKTVGTNLLFGQKFPKTAWNAVAGPRSTPGKPPYGPEVSQCHAVFMENLANSDVARPGVCSFRWILAVFTDRFSHFHCNAMRKTIKGHKIWKEIHETSTTQGEDPPLKWPKFSVILLSFLSILQN